DYIEGITHSICTLEFEVHRPLYDWILDALELPEPRPHQYEFARLNLTYSVISKRKLIQLVNEKLVNGWDDPRMVTISGLRRRGEVRLKYAYIIKCDEVVKDVAGNVIELRCTVDLDSKSGGPTAGRKVKGTIHWVSAAHAIDAEVRLYDRLFTVPEPDAAGDFKSFINSNSLEVVTAKSEPALADACPEKRYQFERLGYFALDPDSRPEKQIWNRTVTLRDT